VPRLAANPAAGRAAADAPSPSRAVPPGWEENPTSFSRRALLAALAGALAYGAELLLLGLAGRDRWRSLPWTCLALGAVLSTGAVVSIVLIVVQPTMAGTWCTLCLVSPGLSLALFALGIGEARAASVSARSVGGASA